MSSLQERIAARRAQREQERTFVIPVNGYEDVGLAARYKVLRYEELRKIRPLTSVDAEPEEELAAYADTIARACVELLEKQPDGSYTSLGCRWTSNGVREVLGVELPEGVTGAREAIFAVFNGDGGGNDLALHFAAYDAEVTAATVSIEDDLVGESGASSATEAPPTSP